jgi:choline dehydrogenase
MAGNDVTDRFDVVIVGGGSAGAALASRLSANPARRVLLVEAGRSYASGAFPATLLDPTQVGTDPEHDWHLVATVDGSGRTVPAPRGKVLGGSSAVNGSVALRARASDIRGWGGGGLPGWSVAEVTDTFRLLENTPDGANAWHGRSGPFPIRQRSYLELTPSLRAFIEGSAHQGFTRIADFNGAQQHGVGPYPLNLVGEQRQNTAMVYLTDEVRRRANLTIRGDDEVDRLIIEGGTATGVLTVDGYRHRAGEVILSAGTFGSAGILLRSGIGPAGALGELGIEVVADLPVGLRFQDQPFYYNVHALAPEARDMSPAAGALLWTASSEARPDELDLHISATHFVDPSISPTGGAIVLAVAVTKPDSIGTVALRSADPKDGLAINYNVLAEPRDQRRMLEGVMLSRQIARDEVMATVLAGELAPGDAVRDDETLARVIREQLASYQHPTSTAPMGTDDDPWAVVDPSASVRGVGGLRVVDASILPSVPSTTTNVTTIMLAEHIARRYYA